MVAESLCGGHGLLRILKVSVCKACDPQIRNQHALLLSVIICGFSSLIVRSKVAPPFLAFAYLKQRHQKDPVLLLFQALLVILSQLKYKFSTQI